MFLILSQIFSNFNLCRYYVYCTRVNILATIITFNSDFCIYKILTLKDVLKINANHLKINGVDQSKPIYYLKLFMNNIGTLDFYHN